MAEIVVDTISLTSDPNVGMSLDAQARLQQLTGNVMQDIVTVAAGIGTISQLPPRIAAAFPTLTSNAATQRGIWFYSGTGQANNCDYCFNIIDSGCSVYCVQSLLSNAIIAQGFVFTELLLKAVIQTGTSGVEFSEVIVSGKLSYNGSLAQINLMGGSFDFFLELKSFDLSDTAKFMANPSSILSSGYTGMLKFRAAGRQFALANIFSVSGAAVDFSLLVLAAGSPISFSIRNILFQLQAAEIVFQGVRMVHPSLEGSFNMATNLLLLKGDVTVILADSFYNLFNPSHTSLRSFVHAHFELRVPSNGPVAAFFLLEERVMVAAVHDLGFSSKKLQIAYTKNGNSWQATVAVELVQSFGIVADWFTRQLRADFPAFEFLPAISISLQASVINNSLSGLVFKLVLLENAAPGARAFEGVIAGMQVMIGNVQLLINVSLNQNGLSNWAIQGSGQISTTSRLYDVIPVSRMQCVISISGGGNSRLPQLKLTLSNNLVTVTLPALSRQGTPLRIFQVNRLDFTCGEFWSIEATGTFNRGGKTLSQHLGISGDGLIGFLSKIEEAIQSMVGGFTVRCSAQASQVGNSNNSSFSFGVEMLFNDAPEFELFQIFSNAGTKPSDPAKSFGCPNLLSVKPARIFFETVFSSESDARLQVGFSLLCSILNESFDASAILELVNNKPVLRLMAGSIDPLTLRIPVPSPASILGVADINKIATDYKLTLAQKEAVLGIKKNLDDFFNAPGQDNYFIFELFNFGITIDPAAANPISVGGGLKLVQFPSLLKAVEPPDGFALKLESSVESISISVETSGSEPLLSIPLGSDQRQLQLFLYALTISYNWAQNAVGAGFNGDIKTKPGNLMGVELFGSGAYLPRAKMDVAVKTTVTVPPIPIPQWSIELFQDNPATAKDDIGLQAWVGIPGHRFITWYIRQTHFSPTYVYLMPGLQFDGGIMIGDINPANAASRNELINQLVTRADTVKDKLYAHFDFNNGLLGLMNGLVAVMLNPLNVVPIPNPVPPYMIVPPNLYGDLFFDAVSVSVNVPGLFFYSIKVEKPLPKLTIQAMLELAALALTGFSNPIPPGSELRKVYYVKCSGDLRIPLAELFSGQTPGASTQRSLQNSNQASIELNIADLMNGMINMAKAVKDVFTNGSDILAKFIKDPSLLVSMIPPERRRFDLSAGLKIAGFSFSGSLYLLTPDELQKELLLFHENKRTKEKGLKAMEPAPAAPTTGAKNLVVEFTKLGSYQLNTIPDPSRSFNSSDPVLLTYQNGFNDRTIRQIEERIKKRRTAIYNEVVNKMTAELIQPAVFINRSARENVYGKYRLEKYASRIENLLPDPSSPFSLLNLTSGKINSIKNELVDYLIDNAEIKVIPGLSAGYAEAAKQIIARKVDLAFIAPASIRPVGRSLEVTPVLGSPVFTSFINIAKFKPAFALEMNVLVDKTIKEIAIPANANNRLLLTAKLETDLVVKLQQHYPAQLLLSKDLRSFLSANFQNPIRKSLPVFPSGTALLLKGITTQLFNGLRSMEVLKMIGSGPRLATTPDEKITVVQGYKIQNKAAGALHPAGEFSVVGFSTKTILIAVKRSGLQFDLQVDNKKVGVLPGWLVNLVPESPRKADKLKFMLEITENKVQRNKTPEEKKYEEEEFVLNDANYLLSILARDEYIIKSTGGRHGKFYFGDLLRNTNGSYIIPSSPVFLAGFTVKIGTQNNYSELGFAGMVATKAAFLHAHSKINLTAAPCQVELEGDFHLITGDLWGNNLAGGLIKDSMSFNGTAVFKMNNREWLRGSASGTIKANAVLELPDLDLEVEVVLNGEMMIGINDLELPDGNLIQGVQMSKISWDSTFKQKLSLKKNSNNIPECKLVGNAAISVGFYVNKGTKKTMVIDEEGGVVDTVVDGFIGLVTLGHADTSGNTEIEYIDYSTTKWELQTTYQATVSASVNNSGVRFALHVPGLGDFNL